MSEERKPLKRVGALWKPREGSKSLGSGEITIGGLRQRFMILRNDRKDEGSKQPDYVLLSSDEPEPAEATGAASRAADERDGRPW